MNITVHQSICIHVLRIGTVANSSIVQIGSSGVIQAKADLYNTGAFKTAAPTAIPAEGTVEIPEAEGPSLVPLSIS
ncbi:spore germination protein PB [Halobacillus alkaliphilus]|uniref:Spore germination protein PB n=1 Tax=Halobacillus alkaliphilus TaxID=396056 RepID=A0A1I2NBE1_9BACI|nr:spore germination protein GerPB [Halobacillus alkaliphilus]SFG00828.1 spore germination protein PB [Halobacillus alkaliphilus]